MREIGYDKPLFVQPFDHRGSFKKGFFALPGEVEITPESDQFTPIARAKTLIYRGLLKAVEMGVDPDHVGILVDTEFGSHIIADARSRGIPVAVSAEKSGQEVYDFEYGARWVDHLRFIRPDMVKVLVRFHPDGDAAANTEQMVRLKELSDYVHCTDDLYFIFELLVPATTAEEKAAGDRYDVDLRPGRMVEAIQRLQDFGVEPDIWKIEGLERREQAEAVAAQARAGRAASGRSRAKAGCIILGRGSDAEKVHHWLRAAAPVPGFIGFAVGRTNFSEPVKRYLANPSEEAAAVEAIAGNYKGCVDVWRESQGG